MKKKNFFVCSVSEFRLTIEMGFKMKINFVVVFNMTEVKN